MEDLEIRVLALEKMLAEVSNRVVQLKECVHEYKEIETPSMMQKMFGLSYKECTKCGLKHNSVERADPFF